MTAVDGEDSDAGRETEIEGVETNGAKKEIGKEGDGWGSQRRMGKPEKNPAATK